MGIVSKGKARWFSSSYNLTPESEEQRSLRQVLNNSYELFNCSNMEVLYRSLKFLCCLIPLSVVSLVSAQEAPSGLLVGTLTFEVEYDGVSTPMRYYSDGKLLKVELGQPGDPYLIWIRGIEELDGVAILNPIKKNYSVEFDGPPINGLLMSDGEIRDRRKKKDVILPKGSATELMGMKCIQYDLNTDGPDTKVWMLENAQPLPYQVTQLWENLWDAAPHISKLSVQHNGVPIQIERKNWRGKYYFGLLLKGFDSKLPPVGTFKIPQDYYKVASQVRGGRGGASRGEKPGGGPGGGGRGR
jgi:hypothetical protein